MSQTDNHREICTPAHGFLDYLNPVSYLLSKWAGWKQLCKNILPSFEKNNYWGNLRMLERTSTTDNNINRKTVKV